MYQYPEDLKYTETHEWVRKEESPDGDNIVSIGITDHAQAKLGELVFVQLPEVGVHVDSADEICVIESVKAASEVYAPLSGEIIEINENLEEAPGLINSSPYDDGWLCKIKIKDASEYDELPNVDDYKEMTDEECGDN